KLRVMRQDHECRNFCRLQFVLPDRTLGVKRIEAIAADGKSRASLARETLLTLLLRRVSADRIVYIAREDAPQCREECHERLAKVKKDLSGNQQIHAFFVLMYVVLLTVSWLEGGWPEVLRNLVLVVFLYLTLTFPLWLFVGRDLRRERAMLTAWLESEG